MDKLTRERIRHTLVIRYSEHYHCRFCRPRCCHDVAHSATERCRS